MTSSSTTALSRDEVVALGKDVSALPAASARLPSVMEWIATLNNPAPGWREAFGYAIREKVDEGWVTYCSGAHELAPTTGTPHWHMAFKLSKQRTRSQIIKAIPLLKLAWLEPRAQTSSWEKTVNYYKYGDSMAVPAESLLNETFFELGDFPSTGAARAAGRVAGGASMKENYEDAVTLAKAGKIWEIPAGLLLKYLGAFQKISGQFYMPGDRDTLDDRWITGPPGCGKSRWVREWCREREIKLYIKIVSSKWWDNYMGEEAVLLDDVDHSMKDYRNLMVSLSDHYPLHVEVKGATMTIRPRYVFYTSNYRIRDIWQAEMDEAAICRRVKEYTMRHGLIRPIEDDNAYPVPGVLKRSRAIAPGFVALTQQLDPPVAPSPVPWNGPPGQVIDLDGDADSEL